VDEIARELEPVGEASPSADARDDGMAVITSARSQGRSRRQNRNTLVLRLENAEGAGAREEPDAFLGEVKVSGLTAAHP
jgi:hypothetical protein